MSLSQSDSGRRPPRLIQRHARFREASRKGIAPRGKLVLEIISGIMGVETLSSHDSTWRRLRFPLWNQTPLPGFTIRSSALKLIGLWPVYVFTGGTVRRLFVVQRQTFS
jgi:hypothetical protein